MFKLFLEVLVDGFIFLLRLIVLDIRLPIANTQVLASNSKLRIDIFVHHLSGTILASLFICYVCVQRNRIPIRAFDSMKFSLKP